jgi:hypothetical protein
MPGTPRTQLVTGHLGLLKGHVDLDLSLLVVHRKLAEQVIELIKAGGVMADGAAAPAQGNVGVRSQLGLQHVWSNLIQPDQYEPTMDCAGAGLVWFTRLPDCSYS